jgi:hypothetical protein
MPLAVALLLLVVPSVIAAIVAAAGHIHQAPAAAAAAVVAPAACLADLRSLGASPEAWREGGRHILQAAHEREVGARSAGVGYRMV